MTNSILYISFIDSGFTASFELFFGRFFETCTKRDNFRFEEVCFEQRCPESVLCVTLRMVLSCVMPKEELAHPVIQMQEPQRKAWVATSCEGTI